MPTPEDKNKSFEEWPVAEHREYAQDIIGQHFVSAYNSWLRTATQMLFEGYQYKSPTTEQAKFLKWIETLSEDSRDNALSFVRDMVKGSLFSILNSFDGSNGSVLKGQYQEQLQIVVKIYSINQDALETQEEPVESLTFGNGEGEELHILWYAWLQKYGQS